MGITSVSVGGCREVTHCYLSAIGDMTGESGYIKRKILKNNELCFN